MGRNFIWSKVTWPRCFHICFFVSDVVTRRCWIEIESVKILFSADTIFNTANDTLSSNIVECWNGKIGKPRALFRQTRRISDEILKKYSAEDESRESIDVAERAEFRKYRCSNQRSRSFYHNSLKKYLRNSCSDTQSILPRIMSSLHYPIVHLFFTSIIHFLYLCYTYKSSSFSFRCQYK